jgi:hypothetical protein
LLELLEALTTHPFGGSVEFLARTDMLQLLKASPGPRMFTSAHATGNVAILQLLEELEAILTETGWRLLLFVQELGTSPPCPCAFAAADAARHLTVLHLVEALAAGVTESLRFPGASLLPALKLTEPVPGPGVLTSLPGAGDLSVLQSEELLVALLTHALGARDAPVCDVLEGLLARQWEHVVAAANAATDVCVGEEVTKTAESLCQCLLLPVLGR